MDEWMSLRAYARHRGVRLSAVQKAIDTRRVTAIREKNGRVTGIERHQADAQWSANTDPVEAARSGTFPRARSDVDVGLVLNGVAEAPGERSQAQSGRTGDEASFLAARVKEAELRGQLLELDKLERVLELLPRAVVRKEFSEIFAQLKTAAFRIPDRKAQALAGEIDPVRIHRILSDELRQVFDEFSRRLDQPTAGVADDAAMAGAGEEVLP